MQYKRRQHTINKLWLWKHRPTGKVKFGVFLTELKLELKLILELKLKLKSSHKGNDLSEENNNTNCNYIL